MPMDAAREKLLFLAALDLDPAQRRSFLDRECRGDADVRARVEKLLAAHGDAGSVLESAGPLPAEAIDHTATFLRSKPTEAPGTLVGRYKLLQQIGEGGMGVVYMAEQEKPVRRRVALKIIKPGMDSAQVIARFEAERQALAMMDHPNIARVLDAGATDNGRPYFVMELVQGIPITKYCDDKQLNTQERLELFMQVCNAVQHAHQKGIIHRDLKPSNVLIAIYDGKPIPKIIDFGVAKALHQRLTEATMFTTFGAVVGTLEYMSPEQAEMDLMGTDTRSDIYSLGVMLYELLTGSTPLDGKKLRSLGYAEMLKTIREVDPPRPSTRLTQSALTAADISAKRQTEPRRLQRLIAGDLDWIVMKCLEKDRSRRYETANGLAMDIRRHLQDETVLASPPGQLYKIQKLVRRNKLTFTAIAAVMLALVLGLAASLWQADRAYRAEARAQAALVQETGLRKEAEGHGIIATALNFCVNGDFPAAEKLINGLPDEFIQEDPTTAAQVFRALGNWNGGEQRWKQAAADFDAIFFGPARRGQNPGGDIATMDYLTYAPLLIELNDSSRYQKLFESACLRASDSLLSERMLNGFLLSPDQDVKSDIYIRWSVQARNGAKGNSSFHSWNYAALGLLNYRQHHYQDAVSDANQCLKLKPPPTCRARAQLVLALAYARLNEAEEARNQLTKSRDVIEAKFAGHLGIGTYDDGLWKDWLIDRILLREAEPLVVSLPKTTSEHALAGSTPQPVMPWARKLMFAGISYTSTELPDGSYEVAVHSAQFTDCSIFKESNIRRLDLMSSGVTDLSPLADLPLESLDVRENPITDLSPLRSSVLGNSLRKLALWKTKVIDFSPVAGCKKLQVFDAADTAITDLSILRGMKLKTLLLARARVSDISVLAGMPLEWVDLDGTKVTDALPLAQCPTLKKLTIPQGSKNVESLRALRNLTDLSYASKPGGDPDETVDQFWAQYDRTDGTATTGPK